MSAPEPPSAETVAAALRDFRNQSIAAERAKQNLDQAITDAAHAGVPQVEIVRVTGYTRERVRQICRRIEEQRKA